VVQRSDFLLEGVIELRGYPGTMAHPAGFIEWHVFEYDGRRFLGHR